MQTPKMVVIYRHESNFVGESFRVIYTDGRPHPKDPDTSYLGHSIAHWEGDTLVVDVTALNDETWLGGGQGHTEPGLVRGEGNHQITEKLALIHSDQEHVVERYTRRGNMLFYKCLPSRTRSCSPSRGLLLLGIWFLAAPTKSYSKLFA